MMPKAAVKGEKAAKAPKVKRARAGQRAERASKERATGAGAVSTRNRVAAVKADRRFFNGEDVKSCKPNSLP